MSLKRVFVGTRASTAVALLSICSLAGAQSPGWHGVSLERAAHGHFAFIQVGHDNIVVDPTIRRYTGMVAALGSPNAEGKLYRFKPSPVGPRSFPLTGNDLRGWRMTVLSGKRFGQVFTVGSNTESEITVTADKGPIDGLDVRDVFIIESIDVNGVSMFGPAAGAGAATSPNT